MADHVTSIAKKYRIDPDIFRALIRQESGGNQGAVSPAGAIGRTQLMPATAAALGVNPHDPIGNLVGGARYLRQQLDHFGGNYHKALAAYNAGPGAVEKYGGVPPYAETQNYVRSILSGVHGAQERGGGSTPSSSGSRTVSSSRTIPGVDRSQERRALILQFLQQRGRPGAITSLATGLDANKDTPSRTVRSTRVVKGHAASTSAASGSVRLAANANRPGVGLTPGIQRVLRQVSSRLGHPLNVGTGTNHNRMTVDGNVSDHWSGNAADIPTTPGEQNIRLGRNALVALGMPRAQAMKATGGIYNLPYGKGRRIQVIFNTNQGGNHHDHVHVGVSAR